MPESMAWFLMPNPDYAGKTPRIMEAVCHDRTPFITIQCRCGYQLHQHESRVAQVPDHVEIASRCPSCSRLLVFPPGFFSDTFAELRREGWIE